MGLKTAPFFVNGLKGLGLIFLLRRSHRAAVHRRGSGGFQHTGTLLRSGAGGKHIVNEQDPLAMYVCLSTNPIGTQHICSALLSAKT